LNRCRQTRRRHLDQKRKKWRKDKKIRIRLKAFDHRMLDQSAVEIVENRENAPARAWLPIPLPTLIESST